MSSVHRSACLGNSPKYKDIPRSHGSDTTLLSFCPSKSHGCDHGKHPNQRWSILCPVRPDVHKYQNHHGHSQPKQSEFSRIFGAGN
jgi:hypothetical protein